MTESQKLEQTWETPSLEDIPVISRAHVAALEAGGDDETWNPSGQALVLLHTVGRKSGNEHKVPLPLWRDANGHRIVVASYGWVRPATLRGSSTCETARTPKSSFGSSRAATGRCRRSSRVRSTHRRGRNSQPTGPETRLPGQDEATDPVGETPGVPPGLMYRLGLPRLPLLSLPLFRRTFSNRKKDHAYIRSK